MQRTIVVKGTGKVSLKPDRIELDLRMRALDKEYRASMEKGALYLSDLRDKLKEAGFDTDDLKTTNFNVERYSEYDSKKREYRFVGYYTNHSLRLGFDFDTELLSKALDAVSNSVSDRRAAQKRRGGREEKGGDPGGSFGSKARRACEHQL